MRIVQEAHGNRDTRRVRQLLLDVVQGVEIVADLFHVGIRRIYVIRLKAQQIEKRRLRPFYL